MFLRHREQVWAEVPQDRQQPGRAPALGLWLSSLYHPALKQPGGSFQYSGMYCFAIGWIGGWAGTTHEIQDFVAVMDNSFGHQKPRDEFAVTSAMGVARGKGRGGVVGGGWWRVAGAGG